MIDEDKLPAFIREMSRSELERHVYNLVCVAIEPPRKRPEHAVSALVPWGLVERIRADLIDSGVPLSVLLKRVDQIRHEARELERQRREERRAINQELTYGPKGNQS